MGNLIGYHFVGSVFSQAEVAKHFDLLRTTKPDWVNIQGAEQYKEALEFAKAIRRELPLIEVMFRHCIKESYPGGPVADVQDDDTGRHMRMQPNEWWERIGKQYIGTGLVIVTDNESMAPDLKYYADWHELVMDIAEKYSVALAVGRFSTHNPPSHQWSQLDPLWRGLNKHHNLHYWSPNIYFSDVNFDGVEHIFEGWRRCADLGIRAPKTVIGEFAYAKGLDPHAGFLASNIDGAAYVQMLEKRGAPLWAAGVPVCVFSVGGWPKEKNTFGLNDAVLKALRERVITPSLIPTAADPRWADDKGNYIAQAKGTVKSFVRATPKSDGVIVGSLQPATPTKVRHIPQGELTADEKKFQYDGKYNWHVIGLPDGKVGYSREDVVTLTPEVVSTPPPTPVDYVKRADVEGMIAAALEKFKLEFYLKLGVALSQDKGVQT